MNFAIGTTETVVPRMFIRDLPEVKVEKGAWKPLFVAGIVSQLCMVGTDLAAFLIEDTTGVWRCEFYVDRCSFGDNFVEGVAVKIKGELRLNNYGQKVIRVNKISKFS